MKNMKDYITNGLGAAISAGCIAGLLYLGMSTLNKYSINFIGTNKPDLKESNTFFPNSGGKPQSTLKNITEKELSDKVNLSGELFEDLKKRIIDNEWRSYARNMAIIYEFNNSDLTKYLSWINEAMGYSLRTKQSAIIIDKSEYTLSLLKDGQVIRQYPLELGYDPIFDKQQEGDYRSPEGKYSILAKKDKGQTVFYKALLINYPNKSNLERFADLRKRGVIAKNTSIGGQIEIHGGGSGKPGNYGGSNWTHGCFALSNEDIDDLFSLVDVGTTVTVVRYGTGLREEFKANSVDRNWLSVFLSDDMIRK
ncbi:MAG: L,D-transpeptidase family protein [Candidatus Woesearchaeota archaeon]